MPQPQGEPQMHSRDPSAEAGARPGWLGHGRPKHLLLLLLAGLVLLTVVGLAMLAAYFLFAARNATPSSEWSTPLEAGQVASIAPDMAALPLAGYPDERVVSAALDAGEFETAYATLAYSTLLPDTVRSGHWLLVGSRLQKTDTRRAGIAYQAALDEAALGPALSDVARADISLQAARGLSGLKQADAARLALEQAENVARYSLTLLPAQRRDLLQQVAAAYHAAGDTRAAEAITADLDRESAGPGIKVEAPPLLLPTIRGAVVLPPAVTSAMAARQAAAGTLATRWLAAGPDARDELTANLRTALQAEDGARAAWYATADSLSDADRLALLHDQVAWLTVKYRAAGGAYGLSLVPDWEAASAQIRSDLAAAYTQLINGYGRQLDTLGATESALGRVELLRQAVLWNRLGLFPDERGGAGAGQSEPSVGQNESSLGQQLAEASRQLFTRQGNSGLLVVVQGSGGRRYYLLAGAQPSPAP